MKNKTWKNGKNGNFKKKIEHENNMKENMNRKPKRKRKMKKTMKKEFKQ